MAVVRSAMRAWLLEAKRRSAEPLEGIAGGAAGGDILFHEVCALATLRPLSDLDISPSRELKAAVERLESTLGQLRRRR